VLVLPFVLALLGDNPMQSEFASHIGLRGKYFCRICWVHGPEPTEESPDTENPVEEQSYVDTGRESNTGSPQHSEAGSDAESNASSPKSSHKKKKGKGKLKETAEQMRDRVTSFIKVWLLNTI